MVSWDNMDSCCWIGIYVVGGESTILAFCLLVVSEKPHLPRIKEKRTLVQLELQKEHCRALHG